MTICMEQKLFPLLYTWHVLFGVVSFFFPSFKELSIPGGCLKIIVDSLCVFHTETRLFAVKKNNKTNKHKWLCHTVALISAAKWCEPLYLRYLFVNDSYCHFHNFPVMYIHCTPILWAWAGEKMRDDKSKLKWVSKYIMRFCL